MISSFRIITRMLFICGNWHHHLISFSIPFSIKTNKQKKKNKAYIRNHLKYRICWELRISTAKEQERMWDCSFSGFRLPPLSPATINGLEEHPCLLYLLVMKWYLNNKQKWLYMVKSLFIFFLWNDTWINEKTSMG